MGIVFNRTHNNNNHHSKKNNNNTLQWTSGASRSSALKTLTPQNVLLLKSLGLRIRAGKSV